MTDKHEDAGLFERLTKINNDYPGANIILHKLGVMPQVRISFCVTLMEKIFPGVYFSS